jgi:hypothetical protein
MAHRQFLKTVDVDALMGILLDVFGSPVTKVASGDVKPYESRMLLLLAGCCPQS